jgi:hypothetical protein
MKPGLKVAERRIEIDPEQFLVKLKSLIEKHGIRGGICIVEAADGSYYWETLSPNPAGVEAHDLVGMLEWIKLRIFSDTVTGARSDR